MYDGMFLVGDIELELTFNYGLFGYGYSYQIKQAQGLKPEDQIQYSLLPRINPPPDQCDQQEPVLISQAVPHPSFIPFKDKAYLSYGKDVIKDLEELESHLYHPTLLKNELKDLSEIRAEYFSCNALPQ